MKTLISYGVIDELGDDIIGIEMNKLTEDFNKSLTDKWIPITDIEPYHDPFYTISYCKKENCEFKQKEFYDIEDCSSHHPEFIMSTKPCHLLVVSCRVIPERHKRYLGEVKKWWKKRKNSNVLRVIK